MRKMPAREYKVDKKKAKSEVWAFETVSFPAPQAPRSSGAEHFKRD
jgi:hypothetical protein